MVHSVKVKQEKVIKYKPGDSTAFKQLFTYPQNTQTDVINILFIVYK